MSRLQQTQAIAKEELKVLEKQESNLNEIIDKVLEIGEKADNDAVAKLCNEMTDNMEEKLGELSEKINQKKKEAGIPNDTTANDKK